MAMMTSDRRARILAAYSEALGGREPEAVDIAEIAPAIFAAVPEATIANVKAALVDEGDRLAREAEALEAEIKRRWPTANDNGAPTTEH
jgi:hypothetical protein